MRLEPVAGSGVSGTVELRPRGDETDFIITLSANDPKQQRREFDVSLRTGTCQSPGPEVEEIDDVHADGRPEHEDEDVVLADIRKSDHILLVTPEDRDQAVACGAIPRG